MASSSSEDAVGNLEGPMCSSAIHINFTGCCACPIKKVKTGPGSQITPIARRPAASASAGAPQAQPAKTLGGWDGLEQLGQGRQGQGHTGDG